MTGRKMCLLAADREIMYGTYSEAFVVFRENADSVPQCMSCITSCWYIFGGSPLMHARK